MSGHFRIDDAISAAARIAYLAAKIMVDDLSPIEYYENQDIRGSTIEDSKWNVLNKLKRQPDKSAFYYWYWAVGVLVEKIAKA